MGEDELRFDGQVAIVTGAGRGLGRVYALALAERGARLVVNDLGSRLTGPGSDEGPASDVAQEIIEAGGEAIASFDSVSTVDGADSIVAAAIERFGRIDIVVNNAGILDPAALPELTAATVQAHLDVHTMGAFNVTRAAWPHLVQRGYGRVVVTTSIGMYGGSYLISYSTAKGAAVSLGRSLADAGAPHGIKVNLLAPAAETRMVTDPEYRAKCGLPPVDETVPPDPTRDPDRVVPMLLALAHERCPVTGDILWAGLGRFARIFLGETHGIVDPELSAEGVLERWDEIVDQTGYLVHATTADAVAARESLIAAELAAGHPRAP
jgi:NAD(P)-dependent dehydrogenase (short-subunit alcohol dehydrogenase family)